MLTDDTQRITSFLRSVVTTKEGYLNLATKDDAGWREHWYEWPKQCDLIATAALTLAQTANVYFSAHLFSEKNALKSSVLPTRTLQADLDHADVLALPIQPTVLVESSPGRHQAYWVLRTDDTIPLDELERISRRVSYAIPDCDRTGWPLGHRMRVPYTYNYKYTGAASSAGPGGGSAPPHKIHVAHILPRKIEPTAFDLLPEPDEGTISRNGTQAEAWLALPHAPHPTHKPRELLAKWRTKLPKNVVLEYDTIQDDRSKALWALMVEAFKAGAPREDVYHLAHNSANNKFALQRHNGTRDLRKDVLRAETYASQRGVDLQALIRDIRNSKLRVHEMQRQVADVCLQVMRQMGEFIHARDGTLWYVRRDLGRPVAIGMRSDWLDTVLHLMFGLNPTESVQVYTAGHLVNYTRGLPPTSTVQSLSYYDPDTNTLLLHTGGKDVLYISADSIDLKPNGFADVLFNWTTYTETFKPTVDVKLPPLESGEPGTWYEIIYGASVNNLVGMERDAAMALLRTWTVFLLMRNAAASRPILALLGQPGAGKSTLARMIYRLIYGKTRSVGIITKPENFDTAVSHDPFVALDNVDSWVTWLPDALAQSASAADIDKRKLFTDSDRITIKRQALVAITAHNPRFTREDVTDRLLILSFKRLDNFRNELEMLDSVSRNRNALWSAIVRDVQAVLGTVRPTPDEIPQFRIEDFAAVGAWCARAWGIEDVFAKAMATVQGGQRGIVLENEQTLVMLVKKLADAQDKTREADEPKWRDAQELHNMLASLSDNPKAFVMMYKNGMALSRKLLVMQDALRSLVNIEARYDSNRGARLWRIANKT